MSEMTKKLRQSGLSELEIYYTQMRCTQIKQHAIALSRANRVITPDKWGGASWPPPPQGGLETRFGLTETNFYAKYHQQQMY